MATAQEEQPLKKEPLMKTFEIYRWVNLLHSSATREIQQALISSLILFVEP